MTKTTRSDKSAESRARLLRGRRDRCPDCDSTAGLCDTLGHLNSGLIVREAAAMKDAIYLAAGAATLKRAAEIVWDAAIEFARKEENHVN